MTPEFNLEVPFETKPPRLKDLVNRHKMGQVWIREYTIWTNYRLSDFIGIVLRTTRQYTNAG